MYEALGDRRRQERIRWENPGRHCPLLEADASACLGCPHNAYQSEDGPVLRLAEKYAPVIAHIRDLATEIELGWETPETLSPEELCAALEFRAAMRTLERETQAKMTATFMAQLMFSKSE